MRAAALSLILFAIAALAGCGGSAANSSTTRPGMPDPSDKAPPILYIPPRGGFQTYYPPHWNAIPGDAMITLEYDMTELGFPADLSIDVPNLAPHLPGTLKIDDVVTGYVSNLKQHMTNVQVRELDQPFPGAAAKRLEITGSQNMENKYVDTILAIHNDQVYVINAVWGPGDNPYGEEALNAVLLNWKWNPS